MPGYTGNTQICCINGLPIGSVTNQCGSAINAGPPGAIPPASQAPTSPAPAAPATPPVSNGTAGVANPGFCQNYPVASQGQVQQVACQMAKNANPCTATLPCSQKYSYTPINPNSPGQQLNYCGIQPTQVPGVQGYFGQGYFPNQVGNTAQAPQSNTPYTALASVCGQAQATHYTACQTGAAQGTVGKCCTVEGNFQRINCSSPMVCSFGGKVPAWAQTAVTAARQQMASMGLGASTVMGGAVAGAILNTELPMAQQDAQTFAAMNQTNVKNLQQTLLSNQAAVNAARQFNAAEDTQVSEFMVNLATCVGKFNANQINAMSQFVTAQQNAISEFNACQANKVSMFNVCQANTAARFTACATNTANRFSAAAANTINEFNAQAANQVNEFNAQNQLLINQSNVQWQRAVNTANTTEINATNNANVQNTFDMSQTALNNEWQMAADQASWAIGQNQNADNRQLTLTIAAMNQKTALSILNSQLAAQTYSQLGQFASSLLGGPGAIGSGLKSLFSGSSNTSACGATSSASCNCTGGDFGGGNCNGGCNFGCFGGGSCG